MFSSLLVVVSLALSIAASPFVVRDSAVSIPLARRFNATGARNVLMADQGRAKFLKKNTRLSKSSGKTGSEPATNGAFTYTADVSVGRPPTTFSLIVDTGSSNTWVGGDFANNPFVPTSTSIDTGNEELIEYGSGVFFGEEFLDTVNLGPFTIHNQSIGAAEATVSFDGTEGILGIGPTVLTMGSVFDGGQIPTVTDNLFAQRAIPAKQVGISFEPTTSLSATNGQLTFGGVDPKKFTGTLHTFPITSTAPAGNYVGFDGGITYGSASGTTILAKTAGIADTGTTLIMIATDALATYTQLTGAVPDDTVGLLKITPAQFANLKSLFFNIGGKSFELTPNAQIWPRSLNTAIGGDADSIYLVISDLGSNSGDGLDFINGFTFLERYYLLFDSGASKVGFAETPFTHATTN